MTENQKTESAEGKALEKKVAIPGFDDNKRPPTEIPFPKPRAKQFFIAS